MSGGPESLGRHLVADYWGCDSEFLGDCARLEALMLEAAVAAETTVVAHSFATHATGISGIVVVSESHLSIHTDKEAGAAFVDIFTCGQSVPEKAHALIKVALRAKGAHVRRSTRGGQDPEKASIVTVDEWVENLETEEPEKLLTPNVQQVSP